MGLLSTIGAASGRAFGFTRSAIAAATDAFFNRVTLLLPGNGTNGAQNNTFLDSSSNNFTITRNGNTTQGTFSPFSQTGWSNYFDGSGDYLTIANNTALDFGSGDFTIEAWVYLTSSSATEQLFWSKRGNSTAIYAPILFGVAKSGSDYRSYYIGSLNGSSWGINGSFNVGTINVPLFTWVHLALVRNGTTFTSYVNGVADLVVTGISGALMTNTSNTVIGAGTDGGLVPITGNLSNVRAVKGTAVYTSGFTPSTTPLTAITNTSVLTCADNRFVDKSSNAFSITVNGNTSVQAFSPFAPTAAYSAATNGGSAYFDGTGDYLSINNNTAFDLSSGDFTVEAWVYRTADTGVYSEWIIGKRVQTPSYPFSWSLQVGNGNKFSFYNNTTEVLSTTTAALNTWYHVAGSRQSGTFRLFVNGVLEATVSSYVITEQNAPLTIGNYPVDNPTFTGYISNARVVKGTALYTSNFTVPTAPLTAVTNTQFLLNFTNGGIIDATGKNVLETVGNAQISTTQSKFGGSSILLDGTGDWLIVPKSWSIASGENFTIEGWFYLTAAQASFRMILSDNNGASGKYVAITASGLELQFGSTGSTTASITQTFSQNTWYHIAVVRSNNVLSIYIDGVSKTVTNATNSASFLDQGSFLYVGRWSGTSYEFVGYIDDLRITKGYARYASNFTPPTAAFPVQ